MDPLVILYSLFGPFLVWPLEHFFPYPYIIEELFKVFVVLQGEKKWKTYLFAGVIFALSETVLYAINVNITGSVGYLFVRFIATSILHSTTFLIIFSAAKRNRKAAVAGFFLSALIHYLYNYLQV